MIIHGQRFVLLLILTVWLVPCAAHGQPSPKASAYTGDPAAFATPYADTLHALIVFVKFRDDEEPGDAALAYREWPLFDDPTTLPAFASHLLAPTPTPPFPDSSLTAYFYQQSQGRFVLYGDVHDAVMVSQHPEAAYHAPQGGYGHLTVEILDRLDAQGLDFNRYDHNRDGQLDYLFIIIRRDSKRDDKTFVYTGISCLDAQCGGRITAGRPRPDLIYDSVRIHWVRSGSILLHRTPGNIIPHRYHVRLMAHEIGHDLWAGFFNHIPPLYTNDVPRTSNRGHATRSLGYVLMAGAGGARDARGDELISAFERDLLGWIDCPMLTGSQDDVRLADLYTTSDCKKIAVGGGSNGRVLYLTNRQRLGPFDQLQRGGHEAQFEMGLLRTTGLLVMLADGVRLDVLPADNSLDLAAHNEAYAGDLFGPTTASQLTPWTRPNSNGYTTYPRGFVMKWQAVDQIRYTGEAQGEMAFDYLEDFRQRPTIREDSWIGEETSGYTFTAPVVVTGGNTLHLNTTLSIANRLRVEPGATVIVQADAEITLHAEAVIDLALGAQLIVEGRLVLNGLLKHSQGARFITRAGGTISVTSPR